METPTTLPNEHPNLSPGPAVAATDRSPRHLHEAFLKHVAEYESQGVEKSQSFESLMAAIQANLFRDALRLADKANQVLVRRTTLAGILDVETVVSRYLRVTRRIARNAQLELQARCLGPEKRSAAESRDQ